MRRARGANAIMAMAFNDSGAYGAIPAGNWHKVPFVSANLGEEQALIESDLLGYGRAPLPPSKDVINNDGDVRVPVDLNNFGYWLKLLLGAPQTEPGLPATGSITFTQQPEDDATITIAGQAFTFVVGAPAANEIRIGANLPLTVENAVRALNDSAVAGVAASTYRASADGFAILIEHDALGLGGNARTLAASADAHAVLSGATLAGGAAAGAFRNVYEAGALELPDACVEIGLPDAGSFGVNFGVMANTMAIELQRSGHLAATIGLIAQGERRDIVTAAAGADELPIERFSQFSGLIERRGVPLGDVVSGTFNYSNGLDKVEVIRPDGRIAGADPGMMSSNGNLVTRFKDTSMIDIALNGEPIDLTWSWRISAAKQLRLTQHSVYLPKPRFAISGPGGVQGTFAYQASAKAGSTKFLTASLISGLDHSA